MNIQETEQVLNKYSLDRDIPEGIWNKYLKKYSNKYKVFIGEERTYKIKCSYGHIEPYSLKKGLLCFCGYFESPNKKTYFLKGLLDFCETTQEGYDEVVVKFPEEKLPILCDIFKVKRKRVMSDETKERLKLNVIKMLEKRKLNKK